MENEAKRNDCDKPDKFQFKEPFVLSSILSLMLVCGITSAVASDISEENTLTFRTWYEMLIFYRNQSPVMALGVLLQSILSETKGRKPTFITLTAASVLVSGSLHALMPYEDISAKIALVLEKNIRGGIFATTFLAIPEFCSPKHRFAYLIANIAAFYVGRDVTLLFKMQVEGIVTMRVILGVQLVIDMFCLGVAFVGPESPYWLARKGRVEEGQRALLWLRGEGSEAELSSILKQHQPRNVRVFWLSLLAGMSAISVSAITHRVNYLIVPVFDPTLRVTAEDTCLARLGVVTFLLPIIAMISYKVNHKSIFLATSIIPLGLVYVLAFRSYMHTYYYYGINNDYSEKSKLIATLFQFLLYFGPFSFGFVSSAEVIPSKYNTYVNCICFIYFHLMILLTDYSFLITWMQNHGLFILGATVSLICVFIFYFSSPETKDKMLLDIQKLYTPRQRY